MSGPRKMHKIYLGVRQRDEAEGARINNKAHSILCGGMEEQIKKVGGCQGEF